MIPPLYAHQKRIIDEDKKWTGLWLGTGSAKSRTALELAQKKILCIVPKQQRLDENFEKTLIEFDIKKNITTLSKEEFRRDWETLPYYDTIVVDEAHYFFSGVNTTTHTKNKVVKPKVSGLFSSLYYYLKKHRPERFYALTATPMSKPMNVYAIMCLFSETPPDYFGFRQRYYFERKKGYISFWIPRNTPELQNELTEIVKQYGYTGQLSDYFDVPLQSHKTIYVEITKEQKEALHTLHTTDADPMSVRARERTIENGILYDTDISGDGKDFKMSKITRTYKTEKMEHILALAEEFPKLLVFANYIGQVDAIADELRDNGYIVYTLTGQSKDREHVISNANKPEPCIVVAQCDVSSGYELPEFRCTVFASKSFKVLSYIQSLGRTLRANHLRPNLFVHLVTKGGRDEDCHDSIISGRDFSESIHF